MIKSFKKKTGNVKNYLKTEYGFYTKNLIACKYVPEVFCYYETNERRYMIMQLCGPNLNLIAEKLPRKKFTYECIQKIAYVAIDILREIHAANLIYRDMKPDNFMTTRDNTHPYILLIDFGLSKE